MKILSKPWFLAIIGLVCMVGTQFLAVKLYWSEIVPHREERVHLVKRQDPQAITWGFSSEEIKSLSEELENRLAFLELREGELAAYEARLQADRAEIDDIKAQVDRMRNELMQGVVELEASEQKNLKTLAKTYSALTPEAAVNIFAELDDATVVKILFFMKTDTVGAILQQMATANGGNQDQIARAARISNMLRLFSNDTANQLTQN